MAWSTQQLADLVGVSLRSIRHWHDVGLLPEPARLSNSYKQYTGRHLVQALKIARLSRLGFGLDRIGAMLESEAQGKHALLQLRDELANKIEDLERLKAETEELITLDLSPDLSPAALLALDLLGDEPGSRDVAIVMSHLVSREDTAMLAETLDSASPQFKKVSEDFSQLPENSSEETILELAKRVAGEAKSVIDTHNTSLPQMNERFPEHTSNDMLMAVSFDNMNPAQQRVMQLALKELEQD